MRKKRIFVMVPLLLFAASVAGAWFYFQSREIKVWVYTDYAFRFNHKNWDDLILARFNTVNAIYRRNGLGIRWKVVDWSQIDPTKDIPGIDNRRATMALHLDRPTDIFVVLTGVPEGQRTGSVSPFTRVAVLEDYPDKPETVNSRLLAHELSYLFGAPHDPALRENLMEEKPGSERFPPGALTVIRRMRNYPFADGIDGLSQGSWEKKALAALAEVDAGPQINRQAHAQMVIGSALLGERKREGAIAHFRLAVQIDPKNEVARLNLIEALTRNGQEQAGLQEARELVRLFPDNPLAHRALGAMLGRTRNLEAGVQELEVAAQLDPRNADNRILMGMELAGMFGHIDDAIAALDEAVRLSPDSPRAREGLEKAQTLKQIVSEALAREREQVHQNPNDPDANYRLAKAEARMGDLKSAIRDFQKSADLRPTSGTPHMELAQLYLLTGDTNTAWAEVRKARELGTEPPQSLLIRLPAQK